ncbi:MAG: ribosome maturation factor RimP [Ruminococcus sp.]|jgi:ribosome maturation factor RimP|nr:ribosome maturation factor RimP [Ruminococcus sp.]
MAQKVNNTVSKIYAAAEPIAKSLGLTIWDIVYEKEGSLWYLRVYIEKPGSILTIEDCENMTRPLDKKLDELDPIDTQYILEVSSPGLGRKLTRPEHFKRFLGETVKVRFIRETDGFKELDGILTEFSDNEITVLSPEPKKITLSKTAFVKLTDDENLFDES